MFILRILGGPLFGVEVALPQKDCFIKTVNITHARMAEDTDVAARDIFLSLPVAGEAPNLRLKQEVDAEGNVKLVAECYEQEGMSIREIPLNQPIEFGAARFAVRHGQQAWSAEVERGAVLPQQASKGPSSSRPVKRSVKLAAVCLLVLVVVAAAAWRLVPIWARPANEKITALLAGVPCQIIEKERRTYVIADDAAAMAWARRLLMAGGMAGAVELRSRAADTEKAELKLEQEGTAFFRVDLTDARRPVILLRADGGPPSEKSMVDAARRVVETLPYVTAAVPVYRYAQEARAAALDVAAQLGVTVESRETGNRLVVAIEGALDDVQLSVLSRGLTRLQSTWGKRYVNFIVKQMDMTNTQGMKSGVAGYRILSGRHVVFSSFNPNAL